MAETGHDGLKVLVTGAAGFIGYHLARRMLAAGATVTGLDNLNDYYDVTLKAARLKQLESHANFTFVQGDIVDYAMVADLFERTRPDIVVHLAAQAGVRYSLINPRSYVSANVDGFLSILEAARAQPPEHLIYASSSSVYGTNSKVPFHEDDPVLAPASLYAATKRANELMAETYARLYGLRCSGLRFFTVYGPWGRPDMAYFKFTKAIIEGRPIDVYNNGRMRRDFTYIDDVTEAMERLMALPTIPQQTAAGSGAPHTIYNVGNHTPVELGTFIAAIEARLGMSSKRRMLPMQPGDVPETFADVARLARATGFQPNTPLEHGLGAFVGWYRDFYKC